MRVCDVCRGKKINPTWSLALVHVVVTRCDDLPKEISERVVYHKSWDVCESCLEDGSFIKTAHKEHSE